MADNKHLIELDKKLGHEENPGSAIGRCLNRHRSGAPNDKKISSCFHRWQAYEKMVGDSSLYDWPKYKKLTKRKYGMRVKMPGMPPWADRRLDKPVPPPPHKDGRKVGNWNVGGYGERRRHGGTVIFKNFYERASVPYNHEAHHVVPNGIFNDTITAVFSKGVSPRAELAVRRGLLKNKYNLNHKVNMIMLPMDKIVADTIGLPRHKKTWKEKSHNAYCLRVQKRLKKIFKPLKDQMAEHKTREYDVAKSSINSLSTDLYNSIKSSSAASLPEMSDKEMGV